MNEILTRKVDLFRLADLQKDFVSIIIPAFNEEKRIIPSLDKILEYIKISPHRYEIIVVDDGSVDATVDTINEYFENLDVEITLLKNRKNRGKGFSVQKGFMHAKGEYLLFSDADISTPIEEIEKLMEYMEAGYDIAIGSRALKESDIQIKQRWYREYMGKCFNLLVSILLVSDFKDTQCGFKIFKREAALKIARRQTLDRFSFDVEMLFIAKKLGYRIKEVPIRWLNNPESKVHVLKDSVNMFFDLLKIRMNALFRRYVSTDFTENKNTLDV